MNQLFLYLAVYFATLIIISIVIAKKSTDEDFLVSGRKRGSYTIAMSKFAASIGVSWFVSYTAYAYEFGMGLFLVLAGLIISYIVFGMWAAPRINRHAKKESFYTQGDFVFFQTKSETAKKITNILSMITQLTWMLVGTVGGAKIISSVGLVSYEVALLITTVIIAGYLLIAGYNAVIMTDAVQSGVILILLIGVAYYVIDDIPIAEILATETERIDVGTAIGFLIYGLFSVFALTDRYQLCYAAKDEEAARKGMTLSVLPITIAAVILLLLGMMMYMQNPNIDPDLAFLEILVTNLPEGLLSIAMVLFFAGLMSSADTQVYAIASHLVLSKKRANPVTQIRIMTIVILAVATVLSYFFRSILDITILGATITISLSIPMIYVIAGKQSSRRFIFSTVGGLLGLVVGMILLGGIDPSMLITTLLGGIIGLIAGRRRPEVVAVQ